jgi:hypothetical protein
MQTVREWTRREPQAFLKRASGCFQNVGKNVLSPETVWKLRASEKIIPGHI